MIADPDVAKQINDMMQDVFQRLCESCEVVKERCSGEDYTAFKKATSKIAGGIVFDVLEPLYEKHPSLKPANWDET